MKFLTRIRSLFRKDDIPILALTEDDIIDRTYTAVEVSQAYKNLFVEMSTVDSLIVLADLRRKCGYNEPAPTAGIERFEGRRDIYLHTLNRIKGASNARPSNTRYTTSGPTSSAGTETGD